MSWQTAKQDAAKLAELYPASLAGEHITLSAYADGETYRQLSYQLAQKWSLAYYRIGTKWNNSCPSISRLTQ